MQSFFFFSILFYSLIFFSDSYLTLSFFLFHRLHCSVFILWFHCFFLITSLLYTPLVSSRSSRFFYIYWLFNTVFLISLPIQKECFVFYWDYLPHFFLFVISVISKWILNENESDDFSQKKIDELKNKDKISIQSFLYNKKCKQQLIQYIDHCAHMKDFSEKCLKITDLESIRDNLFLALKSMYQNESMQIVFEDHIHQTLTIYHDNQRRCEPLVDENLFWKKIQWLSQDKTFLFSQNVSKDMRYSALSNPAFQSFVFFPFFIENSLVASVRLEFGQTMTFPVEQISLLKQMMLLAKTVFIKKQFLDSKVLS